MKKVFSGIIIFLCLCISSCGTNAFSPKDETIEIAGGTVGVTAESLGLTPIDFLAGQKEPIVIFEGANGSATAKLNISFEKDQIIYDDGSFGVIGNIVDSGYGIGFEDNTPICELYKDYKKIGLIFFNLQGELGSLSNGDTVTLVIESNTATDPLKMNRCAPKYNYIKYIVEGRPEKISLVDNVSADDVLDFANKEIQLPEDTTFGFDVTQYSNLNIDSIYYVEKERTIKEPASTYIAVYYSYDFVELFKNSFSSSVMDEGKVYKCLKIEEPYLENGLQCKESYSYEVTSEDIIESSEGISVTQLY